MSDLILDQSIDETTHENVKFGGFWHRAGAMLLDGLILLPITVFIFFNMLYWKSLGLSLIINFISLVYKPFMEYKYGATFGKKFANLLVVDQNFQSPSLTHILLRNSLHLGVGFLSIITAVYTFMSPGFEDVTSFSGYSLFVNQLTITKYMNSISGLVYLVDIIMLISDKQKRSLHDRIGNTFVIKHYKNDLSV